MKPPESSAKIIWTYGVITGVCLPIVVYGVLWIANFLGVGYLLGGIGYLCLALALVIAALLLVGMLATKRTGQVRAGRLAGLVAGLTVGIILCAFVWIFVVIGGGAQRIGSIDINSAWGMFVGLVIAFALTLSINAGIGALIGTLGGVIGKAKAKLPPTNNLVKPLNVPQQQAQQYPPQ